MIILAGVHIIKLNKMVLASSAVLGAAAGRLTLK